MKTKLEAGMHITLLDKHGKRVADTIVEEVTKTSVVLSGGDSFQLRHVVSEELDVCVVQLSVSDWL